MQPSLRPYLLREAEVSQFVAALTDEHICRLYVSVDYAHASQVLQGAANLPDGLPLEVPRPLIYLLLQRPALTQLCDYIAVVGGIEDVDQPQNVGVLQPPHDGHLVLQHLAPVTAHRSQPHHLDGHFAIAL